MTWRTPQALGIEQLGALLELQRVTLRVLGEKPWLRANTEEMFRECLEQHHTLGLLEGDKLIAAGILYDGGTGSESIRGYVSDDEAELRESINLKLILTDPEHRGAGFARNIVRALDAHAASIGKRDIRCTIHPDNVPSQNLFRSLGYVHIGDMETKYGTRLIFGKTLVS